MQNNYSYPQNNNYANHRNNQGYYGGRQNNNTYGHPPPSHQNNTYRAPPKSHHQQQTHKQHRSHKSTPKTNTHATQRFKQKKASYVPHNKFTTHPVFKKHEDFEEWPKIHWTGRDELKNEIYEFTEDPWSSTEIHDDLYDKIMKRLESQKKETSASTGATKSSSTKNKVVTTNKNRKKIATKI
jgi:hypothetical protein